MSVIAKKLSGARVGRVPIPGIEDIGEHFAKLLEERLRGMMRTITSAIVLDCEIRKLSAVLEEIPVPAMIGVVDVSGSANSALVNISTDLLFHIVDLRMGGDPSDAPIPTARSITPIDCALSEDFITAGLDAFEAALRLHLSAEKSSQMSLRNFEQHATMVRIAPEHSDVLVLKLSLDLGEAARSGDFDLVLPLAVLDSYKTGRTPSAGSDRGRLDVWNRCMTQAAWEAPVRLRSVLHRFELSIADIEDLSPGDVLPLPPRSRQEVELHLEGREDGQPVAVGRLGAMDGRKALKLSTPPEPTLQKHLRQMAELPEEAA